MFFIVNDKTLSFLYLTYKFMCGIENIIPLGIFLKAGYICLLELVFGERSNPNLNQFTEGYVHWAIGFFIKRIVLLVNKSSSYIYIINNSIVYK